MRAAVDGDILIEANQMPKEYFKDLIRYRELFFFLAWRDILVRYKQAAFGIAWAVIRPLLNMAVFSFIFGKIAHLSSNDVPYPLFVLAGMLPWQLVSGVLFDTCSSLVGNVHLITKVYFPRIILSTSQILVHLVDFGINLALLFIFMLFMGSGSLATIWSLPLCLLLALVLCVGSSLWLSALTVQYRDFRFIVTFIMQFGMFISPVGYGTYIITGAWKWLYFMNPMVGIIDAFRWSLFGIEQPDILWSIAFSLVISSLILVTGIRYFRKTERSFADRI
ncbi:MAG TPA: ABC transporter permease [Parachlamydiaceae bacterium]|nr:ABC transporter permease [Parachlamydiaceae bacterium]